MTQAKAIPPIPRPSLDLTRQEIAWIDGSVRVCPDCGHRLIFHVWWGCLVDGCGCDEWFADITEAQDD